MVREEVVAQARQYGEEVRLAEDKKMESLVASKRRAWEKLLNSVRGTLDEVPARNAYLDAYCEE